MHFLENLLFLLAVWTQKEVFEVQDAMVLVKDGENLSAMILLTSIYFMEAKFDYVCA